MYVTCCTVCYMGHKWPEVLDKIAADGWTNIELVAIPHWIHVDLSVNMAREIKKELGDRGITLRAIHSGSVTTSNPQMQALQLAYARRAIETLEELGANQLVFTGGPRDQDKLDDLASAVEKLAESVEGTSIKIGLENHYKNRIETLEDYDFLLSRIQNPQVGITADGGHFNSSKVDTVALLNKYKDRVFHYHVKDHLGTVSVPLGQGEVDIGGQIKVLKEIGFDRCLSVELHVKDQENLDKYAGEAFRYLTAKVEEAGAA